jgi:hypothetical protein
MNERNPYAPPKADLERVGAPAIAPALWNPSAAASWSLLFSPIFGAILHMKNWQALGETQKAAAARSWAIGIAAFFILLTLVSVVMPESRALDSLSRIGGLGLLLAWYFVSGKPQQTYVRTKFGDSYPRRGWSKPLLLALLVLTGYFAIVFIALLLFGLLTGRA